MLCRASLCTGAVLALLGCDEPRGGRGASAPDDPVAEASEDKAPVQPQSRAVAPLRESGAKIPAPGDIDRVDIATKRIELVVLIVGPRAFEYLTSIAVETTDTGGDERTDGGGALRYMPMTLGPIRDFTVRLHLYAFADGPPDPLVKPAVERADGIIVAGSPSEHESTFATIASRSKSNHRLDVAIVGGDEATWTKSTGVAPATVLVWPDGKAVMSLKPLTKAMLTRLRESD